MSEVASTTWLRPVAALCGSLRLGTVRPEGRELSKPQRLMYGRKRTDGRERGGGVYTYGRALILPVMGPSQPPPLVCPPPLYLVRPDRALFEAVRPRELLVNDSACEGWISRRSGVSGTGRGGGGQPFV